MSLALDISPSRNIATAELAVSETHLVVGLYQRLVRGAVLSIAQGIVGCLVLVAAAPTLLSPPVPPVEAIGTTVSFRITPLHNLALSEAYIARWAARTITSAYAIDPVDFQAILTRVRQRFSTAAWQSFAASYKAGGSESDLHKLLAEALTGFAQRAADPVVVHRTFGRDARFTVAFPMIVTWQNPNGLVSRRYDVHVVVRRTSVMRHAGGLEIMKFTAISKGS
ncbi:DotI/IcmL family type IV secretion protein [Acidiphilium sp. PA]|uniref:DotI/IcmL family type IV secretion protein n=1 Tax=Acidiphilium sp. PA TaxID=2871705 RepID=UPI002243E77E|nr:DotI/IcmL family type IV secretion protein [Acidiphilium sp. PA]MCW8308531.1 DotI/IcmL family type IV secretion protein [Acidiphilium sp. PA]